MIPTCGAVVNTKHGDSPHAPSFDGSSSKDLVKSKWDGVPSGTILRFIPDPRLKRQLDQKQFICMEFWSASNKILKSTKANKAKKHQSTNQVELCEKQKGKMKQLNPNSIIINGKISRSKQNNRHQFTNVSNILLIEPEPLAITRRSAAKLRNSLGAKRAKIYGLIVREADKQRDERPHSFSDGCAHTIEGCGAAQGLHLVEDAHILQSSKTFRPRSIVIGSTIKNMLLDSMRFIIRTNSKPPLKSHGMFSITSHLVLNHKTTKKITYDHSLLREKIVE